jgi:glycosyltransferase involved in cell wall biosynthesis
MAAGSTMEATGASVVNVAHVLAGLEPAHGGPSYSVPRLCEALAATGDVRPRLYSVRTGDRAACERSQAYADLRFDQDHAGIPVLGHLRLSRGLARALRASPDETDVIHSHGLWLAPNLSAARAAKRAGKPHVVSARGMLSAVALGISANRKRLAWALAQREALRQAACLHATSESELEDLRAAGLRNPVAVIPNGIDVPPMRDGGQRSKVVLALGRIHPKKGLASLVRAWARVEPLQPEWRLRIVGPAEADHDQALAALARRLHLGAVSIEAALFGEAKLSAYQQASLFVLPTLSENFGLVVGEALAGGTPVISTKGAPWEGLELEGCGWWIDHGETALAEALATAMALPGPALAEMGERGRCWVARDFAWERIARQMGDVYRWLAGRGQRPSSVFVT